MVVAVTPSSTRHDWGEANSGASQRAPKPMAVNHSALAKAPRLFRSGVVKLEVEQAQDLDKALARAKRLQDAPWRGMERVQQVLPTTDR